MSTEQPKKSWKTTTAAICAAVGVLLGTAAAALDGNPETVVDMAGAMAALSALLTACGVGALGVLAKDKSKGE